MILSPRLARFTRSDGKSRIYIYAYDPVTRKKTMIPTPFYVKPSEWDGDRVSKKAAQASYLNPKLNQFVLDLQARTNKGAKMGELKAAPGDTHTPVTYFRHYIELCKRGEIVRKDNKEKMTTGYLRALGTSAKYLERFAKRHRVEWSDLGESFFDRYVNFLRGENFKQNTIAKAITHLLTITRHAKKNKMHDTEVEYFVQKEKTQKLRLTPEEVDKIINLDLTDWPELKAEQERFQVAYNLLLRFSDSVALNEKNVIERDGKHFLSAFTQKGKKEILLPIKKSVYRILKRNGFKLKASNSKSNAKLKKLGLLAGISDKVTLTEFRNGKKTTIQKKKYELIETHTTRRSAARNLFDSGLAPEIIMTLGGWSTMKQLLDYIDIDLEYAAGKAADHPFFD